MNRILSHTLICFTLFCLTVFAFEAKEVIAQPKQQVKILDPLGLTRAFQNNVQGKMKVQVRCKGSAALNSITLENRTNGKAAAKTMKEAKSGATLFIFSDVGPGVWSVKILDDKVSIEDVTLVQ